MNLPAELLRLLNEPGAGKIIGIYSTNGKLEVVPLASIKAPRPDVILLAQGAKREANKSLIYRMETDDIITLLFVAMEQGWQRTFRTICKVKEFQTTGPLYEKFLDELRANYAELSGVWVLEPLETTDWSQNASIRTFPT
jgi:hypothetical protein